MTLCRASLLVSERHPPMMPIRHRSVVVAELIARRRASLAHAAHARLATPEDKAARGGEHGESHGRAAYRQRALALPSYAPLSTWAPAVAYCSRMRPRHIVSLAAGL